MAALSQLVGSTSYCLVLRAIADFYVTGEVPFEFTAISDEPTLKVLEAFGFWTIVQDGISVNGEILTGHSE